MVFENEIIRSFKNSVYPNKPNLKISRVIGVEFMGDKQHSIGRFDREIFSRIMCPFKPISNGSVVIDCDINF